MSWRNSMPNQNSVDQNYRGSFHYRGIRPPVEPGFRPGEVGIHPAFRPDYGQQNVYYREIVNSNQSIRQNNGLPHHISRQGYAYSQRNPPQFLPPRQVGPFNKRFTPRHDRSWKPRQAYTQIAGQGLQGGNIHKYFKESMLEDPWKEFEQMESEKKNPSPDNIKNTS